MGLEYRFVLDYLEGRYGSAVEMAAKLEIAHRPIRETANDVVRPA
jgi:hypothetical protein